MIEIQFDDADCSKCVHNVRDKHADLCSYNIWKECVKVDEVEDLIGNVKLVSTKTLFSPKESEPKDYWEVWIDNPTPNCKPIEPAFLNPTWFEEIPQDIKGINKAIDDQIKEFDPVKRPEHYNYTKIECWDWYELAMSDDEFRGAMKNNIWKYTFRSGHKENPVGDLKKAKAYLERWIKFEECKQPV